MAKPILIVKARSSIREEELHGITSSLEGQFDDYHVLITVNKVDDFEFQVFYEKDFDQVKFEELKKIIKENG